MSAIRFDSSLLTVEKCFIHVCTSALGGYVKISDDGKVVKGGKNLTKYDVPIGLTRNSKKVMGVTTFPVPINSYVMMYNGNIVDIEYDAELLRDVDTCNLSKMVGVINSFAESHGGVYVSNQCVYVQSSKLDTKDIFDDSGTFTSFSVSCIKFRTMYSDSSTHISNGKIIQYHHKGTGEVVWTAPLFKISDFVLDQDRNVDQSRTVKLMYLLTVGEKMQKRYGYKSIQVLNLVQFMFQFNTVNLKKMSTQVKSSVSGNISFTSTLSWLFGLKSKASVLDDHIEIDEAISYLLQKGTFRSNLWDDEQIFASGIPKDVPVSSVEESSKGAPMTSSMRDQVLDRLINKMLPQ